MIDGMFNSGSLPVLERVVQFTGQRHQVIANNIANLSTPYFRPKDLSVEKFQSQLRKAVHGRRATETPRQGDLRLQDTREFRFHAHGLEARPQELDENIMFHDRNNRDLERIMQDLAENTLAHNAGLEMLKSEFNLLRMAIRGTLS
ncbi:MAG: flagellar basal body rod protein FlgB [Planctomycetota bacterium]